MGLNSLLELEDNHVLCDLGCGTGRLTMSLAQKAYCTIGVNFSFESLKLFRRRIADSMRQRIHLIQADIFHLPLRNQLFHRVVSNNVFEHLPGLLKNKSPILETARILKNEGLFVLSIYNFSSIRAFFTRLIPASTYGERYEQEGFHAGKVYYRRYRWEEVIDLLSTAFEVERMAGIRIIPKEILKHGGRLALLVERTLQSSTFSRPLGYYLLASSRKVAE